MKIKISRKQWREAGIKAGWIKKAQVAPAPAAPAPAEAVEPVNVTEEDVAAETRNIIQTGKAAIARVLPILLKMKQLAQTQALTGEGWATYLNSINEQVPAIDALNYPEIGRIAEYTGDTAQNARDFIRKLTAGLKDWLAMFPKSDVSLNARAVDGLMYQLDLLDQRLDEYSQNV